MEISVVIPVFDCAPCLEKLLKRIEQSLSSLPGGFEVICVDDCSRDNSWSVLNELRASQTNLVLLQLSRNFGQHAAITAGLASSRGQWVVVMDCDLQDPPETILALYNKAKEGYEIVYAKRIGKNRNIARRWAAYFYSSLLNLFSETRFTREYGNFTIVSRAVVDVILKLDDQDRHYLHILRWLGFRNADINYEHQARLKGKSSYSLKKLVSHALSGVFFQTTVFLKIIIVTGFIISGFSMLLGMYFSFSYLKHGSVPGWTSLAVLILLMGGMTISSIGVCGLYIGRIFDQVRGRPIYVVRNEIRN